MKTRIELKRFYDKLVKFLSVKIIYAFLRWDGESID